MKILFKKILILFLFSSFVFISCETDEVPNPQVIFLMMTDRNTGMFYFVDIETGELTEYDTVVVDDSKLTGVRGMAYHPITERIYTGSNTNAGGVIHELDIKNKRATLINNNRSVNDTPIWFGIADVMVNEDGELKMTTWDRNIVDPGILTMNTSGELTDPFLFFPTSDPCCGMGIVSYNGGYLVGDFTEFHELDIDGNVINSTPIGGTLPGINMGSLYMQNITWINEVAYVLLYDDNNDRTQIGTLNIETGEVTPMGDALDGRYHGLVAVPDIAFR